MYLWINRFDEKLPAGVPRLLRNVFRVLKAKLAHERSLNRPLQGPSLAGDTESATEKGVT
jgi:hypothetical protein